MLYVLKLNEKSKSGNDLYYGNIYTLNFSDYSQETEDINRAKIFTKEDAMEFVEKYGDYELVELDNDMGTKMIDELNRSIEESRSQIETLKRIMCAVEK